MSTKPEPCFAVHEKPLRLRQGQRCTIGYPIGTAARFAQTYVQSFARYQHNSQGQKSRVVQFPLEFRSEFQQLNNFLCEEAHAGG